jgi:dipeptidase D
MDSEDEGELYVGCAGGEDGSFEMEYTPEPLPGGMQAWHVNLTGLKGGHSGMDINLGRGNANKIMMRILLPLIQKNTVRIASIEGGNLRNAIPREAEAVICFPKDLYNEVNKEIESIAAVVKAELGSVDPGLEVTLAPCNAPETVIPACITIKAIRAIYAAPNGVWGMSASMPGLVETSSNLAIVSAKNGRITVHCLLRSLVDTAKEDMGTALSCCFENAGAKASFSGAYPGWKPDMDSPILKTMLSVYKEMYGKEAAVKAIHAGLECGILGGIYPSWDMISFGPTLRSPHSPDERCYVPSVQKFWDLLVETLKNIE